MRDISPERPYGLFGEYFVGVDLASGSDWAVKATLNTETGEVTVADVARGGTGAAPDRGL